MFESRTYEALLASALSRVASPVDKREGSMVRSEEHTSELQSHARRHPI